VGTGIRIGSSLLFLGGKNKNSREDGPEKVGHAEKERGRYFLGEKERERSLL